MMNWLTRERPRGRSLAPFGGSSELRPMSASYEVWWTMNSGSSFSFGRPLSMKPVARLTRRKQETGAYPMTSGLPVIREQSADGQRAEHQNTKSQFTSDSTEGRITH